MGHRFYHVPKLAAPTMMGGLMDAFQASPAALHATTPKEVMHGDGNKWRR